MRTLIADMPKMLSEELLQKVSTFPEIYDILWAIKDKEQKPKQRRKERIHERSCDIEKGRGPGTEKRRPLDI